MHRLRPGRISSVRVPGDKSITHRGIILGAVARGESVLRGWLDGGDCRSSVTCLKQMGVQFEENGPDLIVHGRGPEALSEPEGPLDAGNSGTTMRLLAGLLAPIPLSLEITGDTSLLQRPMDRVVDPLRQMGAPVAAKGADRYGPIRISGAPAQNKGNTPLHGCDHTLAVASAQVKSALLLAGLQAQGTTIVREPTPTRDHTERMLSAMGARISFSEGITRLDRSPDLKPIDLDLPGDPSSAAFFIVLGVLRPETELLIEGIGVNPRRIGLIRALLRMGGTVEISKPREKGGEPVADIRVRSSRLRGITVGADEVPSMIDELPLLALAATLAEGKTLIRGAAELRVKESDRIEATVTALAAAGAAIEELPDGFRIEGKKSLKGGCRASSRGDHRITMMLALADVLSEKGVAGGERKRATISFPRFFETLDEICH